MIVGGGSEYSNDDDANTRSGAFDSFPGSSTWRQLDNMDRVCSDGMSSGLALDHVHLLPLSRQDLWL